MSPLVPIGTAIVVNVGVLVGGVVWLRRQVKRVAAERAALEDRVSPREIARRP